MEDTTSASPWSYLNQDIADQIFTKLPLRSLLLSSAVCKHWRHLLSDPSLQTRIRTRKPWFFLYGQNNVFSKQNQAFGFDPFSSAWIRLPSSTTSGIFAGSSGLVFSSASFSRFNYSHVLSGAIAQTSPLSCSRLNPLIGSFFGSGSKKLIVVGGARFIGGLVDIEDHKRLAVEIYGFASNSWDLGPPLPDEFRSGNSSQWLCSCLLNNQLFFVYGIYSSKVCSFDLKSNSWSPVRTLRSDPNGTLFSYLISSKNRLILAGLRDLEFVLWEVVNLEECREIGTMPREIMAEMMDVEGDYSRFASLKCVGSDGVVYVYNEDHCRGYPCCVCEIGEDDDSGDGVGCRWRMVPSLVGVVSRFHKVVGFCSQVGLEDVLGGGGV